MNWTNRYRKAFALSYDDGVYQDIRLVEILNRFGLKCTFNLNSGLMTPASVWEAEGVRVERMPADMLPEVYRGHEIASHTVTHGDLTQMDDSAIADDLRQDIASLDAIFGGEKKIRGFAYPYGTTDARVQAVIAQCGITYARGVHSTFAFEPPGNLLHVSPTCRHKDENIFALAEQFIAMQPDRPQIFLLWGHSYEFDMQRGWERFERFCDLIAGHEDVYYGTCREILVST